MLTPRRIETEELLDEHDAPEAEMLESLRDLRRINFWLGGIAIYRSLLRKMTGGLARPVILDIGTGTSDLLASLPERTMKIGLDFNIRHLLEGRAVAPGDGVLRVVGDARSLPFRDGAVDVVTSAHFFHHFSPDENAGLLRESLRAARAGVVVNDTRRHYAPLLFVRLLGWLRLVGRITRFDAPASVLQGYTLAEARDVAAAVGARRWRVVRKFPFRFGLLLWK